MDRVEIALRSDIPTCSGGHEPREASPAAVVGGLNAW
jgi:hypothetical protein